MTNDFSNNEDAHSITQIVHWLTGAYAEGLPVDDRTALVTLLAPRLPPDRILQVMTLLTPHDIDPEAAPIQTPDDLDALLRHVAKQPPSVIARRRVAGRLASAGWPLSGTT